MNHQIFNYKPREVGPQRARLGYTAALLILLLGAYALAQHITDLGDAQAKVRELEQYREKLRILGSCSAQRYAYPLIPPAAVKPRKEM